MHKTGISTEFFSALPGCEVLGEFLTEFGSGRIVYIFYFFREIGDIFHEGTEKFDVWTIVLLIVAC